MRTSHGTHKAWPPQKSTANQRARWGHVIMSCDPAQWYWKLMWQLTPVWGVIQTKLALNMRGMSHQVGHQHVRGQLGIQLLLHSGTHCPRVQVTRHYNYNTLQPLGVICLPFITVLKLQKQDGYKVHEVDGYNYKRQRQRQSECGYTLLREGNKTK